MTVIDGERFSIFTLDEILSPIPNERTLSLLEKWRSMDEGRLAMSTESAKFDSIIGRNAGVGAKPIADYELEPWAIWDRDGRVYLCRVDQCDYTNRRKHNVRLHLKASHSIIDGTRSSASSTVDWNPELVLSHISLPDPTIDPLTNRYRCMVPACTRLMTRGNMLKHLKVYAAPYFHIPAHQLTSFLQGT